MHSIKSGGRIATALIITVSVVTLLVYWTRTESGPPCPVCEVCSPTPRAPMATLPRPAASGGTSTSHVDALYSTEELYSTEWSYGDHGAVPCVTLVMYSFDGQRHTDYFTTDFMLAGVECGVRILGNPTRVTDVTPIMAYVTHSNHWPQLFIPGFFEDLRARGVKRIGLFHQFDGWCNDPDFPHFDVGFYKNFDFVIRDYLCLNVIKEAAEKAPNTTIVTTPAGFNMNWGTTLANTVTRASIRSMLVTFVGQDVVRDHFKVLKTVLGEKWPPEANQRVFIEFTGGWTEHRVSRPQYRLLLRESIFCLECTVGSSFDSFRLSEAIDAGCIPLMDTDRGKCGQDYETETKRCLQHWDYPGGGPCPFPVVLENWQGKIDLDIDKVNFATKAMALMDRLMADPVALDELQARVYRWWRGYMKHIQREISDGMLGPHTAADFAGNSTPEVMERVEKGPLARTVEILRPGGGEPK